jgi:hypothetical protein
MQNHRVTGPPIPGDWTFQARQPSFGPYPHLQQAILIQGAPASSSEALPYLAFRFSVIAGPGR